MTPAETSQLEKLEAIVAAGKKTYLEVGKALAEIKARKLYRDVDTTWEAYCQTRWHFTKQHCDRLIAAATFAEMEPIGSIPANEHQARALRLTREAFAGLPAEEQKRLVEEEERQALASPLATRHSPLIQGGDGRGKRIEQIRRLLRRVRKLTEGIGPEAEESLAHLQAFESALAKIEE